MAESLYTYKVGTTEIEPLLATAMPEISEDGMTYTIPVREGVTFHDGTPFNAKAMEFSLQRFIENGGKPAFLLGDVIKSVEATGDYELQIALKQPFAALTSLCWHILELVLFRLRYIKLVRENLVPINW